MGKIEVQAEDSGEDEVPVAGGDAQAEGSGEDEVPVAGGDAQAEDSGEGEVPVAGGDAQAEGSGEGEGQAPSDGTQAPGAIEPAVISETDDSVTLADGTTVEVPKNMKTSQRRRFKEIVTIIAKSGITRGITPAGVRSLIEQLGPTYVKIGQIMSMRPDIIPKEYCAELSKLRTDVDPLPFDTIRQVLEETYGGRIENTFEKVDPEPLGSASIAQAHSAYLKGGDHVVLKIQRPGIYETMAEDISILRNVAKTMKFVAGDGPFDFPTILDEMWVVAQEEMDFLVEAKHAEQFAEYNADETRVSCPKIYDELSTSKVLCMEFIDGISVGDTDKLDAAGYDRDDLGMVFLRNYVKQALVDGFFHADPHPGNVWVRDNTIVWIDLGMMGHLSTKERGCISDIMQSVVTRDVSKLKEAVLTLGVYRPDDIDHPKLYSDLDTYLTRYGKLDMESVNMGTALSDLIELARSNRISMPSSISMFARGSATAEGTLETLSPKLNILKVLTDEVEKSTIEDFDLKSFLVDRTRELYSSSTKAVEIPGLASDLLKMTLRGRTKINMETRASESLTSLVHEVVDKTVGGLLVAAFLIGSSFLCTTDMNPKILGVPALGVIGFIVAVVLGVLIFWDASSRRKRRGEGGLLANLRWKK